MGTGTTTNGFSLYYGLLENLRVAKTAALLFEVRQADRTKVWNSMTEAIELLQGTRSAVAELRSKHSLARFPEKVGNHNPPPLVDFRPIAGPRYSAKLLFAAVEHGLLHLENLVVEYRRDPNRADPVVLANSRDRLSAAFDTVYCRHLRPYWSPYFDVADGVERFLESPLAERFHYATKKFLSTSEDSFMIIPVVGTLWGLIIAVTGVSEYSGRKFSVFDRIILGLGAMIGAGGIVEKALKVVRGARTGTTAAQTYRTFITLSKQTENGLKRQLDPRILAAASKPQLSETFDKFELKMINEAAESLKARTRAGGKGLDGRVPTVLLVALHRLGRKATIDWALAQVANSKSRTLGESRRCVSLSDGKDLQKLTQSKSWEVLEAAFPDEKLIVHLPVGLTGKDVASASIKVADNETYTIADYALTSTGVVFEHYRPVGRATQDAGRAVTMVANKISQGSSFWLDLPRSAKVDASEIVARLRSHPSTRMMDRLLISKGKAILYNGSLARRASFAEDIAKVASGQTTLTGLRLARLPDDYPPNGENRRCQDRHRFHGGR